MAGLEQDPCHLISSYTYAHFLDLHVNYADEQGQNLPLAVSAHNVYYVKLLIGWPRTSSTVTPARPLDAVRAHSPLRAFPLLTAAESANSDAMRRRSRFGPFQVPVHAATVRSARRTSPATDPLMSPLIRFDDVSVAFGDQKILVDASFAIEPGERVCLIGRNGAGKSTTLRLIAGTVEPDAGEIDRPRNAASQPARPAACRRNPPSPYVRSSRAEWREQLRPHRSFRGLVGEPRSGSGDVARARGAAPGDRCRRRLVGRDAGRRRYQPTAVARRIRE